MFEVCDEWDPIFPSCEEKEHYMILEEYGRTLLFKYLF